MDLEGPGPGKTQFHGQIFYKDGKVPLTGLDCYRCFQGVALLIGG